MTFKQFEHSRDWSMYKDREKRELAYTAGQKSIACCGACEWYESRGGFYDCRVDEDDQCPGIHPFEGPCEHFKPRRKD